MPHGTPAIRKHKIGRGALRRIGRVVALYVGLTVAALAGAVVLTPHFGKSGVFAVPVVLVALIVGLLVYVNLPGRLEIGTDGLFIDMRDERRYVAFADLAGVEIYREKAGGKTFVGVELALSSGELFKVPISEDQFGASDRAHALRADVASGIEAYKARERVDHAQMPSRGARSTKEWLDTLRGVGAGANANLRTAPIPAERLWRIIEDPKASPSERAAAAASLRDALDEPARERLRVAASETASPKLRVALVAAAAEDERGLAEALDELDRADAGAGRTRN